MTPIEWRALLIRPVTWAEFLVLLAAVLTAVLVGCGLGEALFLGFE